MLAQKTQKVVLRPDTPVQYIKGVGPKRAEQLARIGIERVDQLLFHFPRKYLDANTVRPIASLVADDREVAIVGKVISARALYARNRRASGMEALLSDESSNIIVRWYGRGFLEGKIEKGQSWLVLGDVRIYKGKPYFSPIEYFRIDGGENGEEGGKGIIPVYPLTEGVSQYAMRWMVEAALPAVKAIPEHLPASVRLEMGYPPRADAVLAMHRPESSGQAYTARDSLAFDELFYLQLMLLGRKLHLKRESRRRIYEKKNHLIRRMGAALPFELTDAQKNVLRQLDEDLCGPHPMNRLVQGDVGSGKTMVALFACLRALENGYQTAIMAPTEVLAEQHWRSLSRLLAALDIEPLLLVGRMKPKEKKEAYSMLASGEAKIAIGTHALIQDKVEFAELGLAVIDEQHRFGVNQRLALKEKGEQTDILVMTATPIPRSLALTLYGDLDVSLIDQLPAGRRPVSTHVVPEKKRADMQRFMAERIAAGERVFVVCPRIEEDEEENLPAAEEWFARYRDKIFPQFNVTLVHGKMKGEEKEAAMRDFEEGRAQVLVGTTVVEVGIDVKEATVIVIEGAERFGLSQLHQLRGRVGRGKLQSWCLLMPSREVSREGYARLKLLEATNDGFKISEEDLRMRGPGDFFGERQSGLPELKIADLVGDYALLVKARQLAEEILKDDPYLKAPENDLVRRELFLRFRDRINFLNAG